MTITSPQTIKDFEYVAFHGLRGTYEEVQRWLTNSEPGQKSLPLFLFSLGASLGNLELQSMKDLLLGFTKLLKPNDGLVIGLDGSEDHKKIYRAFNDRAGVTHRFYRNALDCSNAVLGHDAFEQNDWDLITEFNGKEKCHRAYFAPKKNVVVDGTIFNKGVNTPGDDACVSAEEIGRHLRCC
ncbi:MAG: hypothetical protein M1812_000636 [Candelaria pacifica]|nr:MAG: hypothetical protein M1812_000636 [Candelaria pacifica]